MSRGERAKAVEIIAQGLRYLLLVREPGLSEEQDIVVVTKV
jgi:hypothetical protein